MGDLSTAAQLGWLKARVNKLRMDRNRSEKWLYEQIGMTKTGYRQMWERGTWRHQAAIHERRCREILDRLDNYGATD